MTIRLLAPVANDPKGAVLQVSEDRAKRLIRTGYAEAVAIESPPSIKRKAKES